MVTPHVPYELEPGWSLSTHRRRRRHRPGAWDHRARDVSTALELLLRSPGGDAVAPVPSVRDVLEVARALGLGAEDCVSAGRDRVKVRLAAMRAPPRASPGHLVLVTAMSPSRAGEGKTTVAIGLTDALCRTGASAVAALRQPSMGPVFGLKGGATGSGRAQLHPACDINLHFTGDVHAVTAAHDLLAAAIDNHLHHGNALGMDRASLAWPRVLDVNDRALRAITVGQGDAAHATRFDITAASEVMAILALAADHADLRARLARIVVARDRDGRPVRAVDLRAAGAMAALLSDALLPNLVQTLEGSPALVHTGPFANLAHGTSSVVATRLALGRAEVVLQEAGFGADLGAQKLLDVVAPLLPVGPSLAVLVVTLRGLRYHGGVANPLHHLDVLARRGLPALVAINEHDDDDPADLARAAGALSAAAPVHRVRVHQLGGEGALGLAEAVRARLADGRRPAIAPVYALTDPIEAKVDAVVRAVYGGDGAVFDAPAAADARACEELGGRVMPVCIAKTPYSLSDDGSQVGRAAGFRLRVRAVRLLAGAGLVVPIAGDIMTMPGLPRSPNLERIDIGPDGEVTGLT